mmetsp:Transcript_11386/g.32348  ORF Transcript_11386/g.32348 Transcript_11386/m.32348 type:complete len:243 (-) Transcript_11386:199-927(-)
MKADRYENHERSTTGDQSECLSALIKRVNNLIVVPLPAGSTAAPASALIVRPAAACTTTASWGRFGCLSLESKSLLATKLVGRALLKLLQRVVSTSSLLALLVVVVLEATAMNSLLLHCVRIAHTSGTISSTLVVMVTLIAHSVWLTPVLRVVLVLVLVIVVVVTAAVSTAILVVSARPTGLVGILLRVVIVMGSAISLVLPHDLLVSKTTLSDATKLTISVVVADASLVLTHVELMLTIVG